jgi:Undecaprenyl-phosphate glucose phosphotransferase
MTEFAASGSFVRSGELDQSTTSVVDEALRRPISEPVVSTLTALFDAVAVLASGAAAMMIDKHQVAAADRDFIPVTIMFAALLAVNLGNAMRAYRFETLRRVKRSLTAAVPAWLVSACVMVGVLRVGEIDSAGDQTWAIEWLGIAFAALISSRLVLGQFVRVWTKAGRLTRHVAIVGAGANGERILRHLKRVNDPSIVIAGVYEDRHRLVSDRCMGIPIRGSVNDLIFDIRNRRLDTVIVSLPLTADQRLTQIVEKLRQTPVTVALCPEWFDKPMSAAPAGQLAGIPLLRAAEPPLRDWRGIAKAIEDRVLALIILLMISPILLAIAVAIKIDSPGPVFFRQKRYGLNNELIEVLKFRSMYHHKADANAEQLTRRNDPRVTKIGAFIRRTSLDELPQFINVLRGEMSIVGPRPHAMQAKAGGVLYPDAVQFYHSRHRVKPGITGWAQVNGWRGETETVEQIVQRVEHDLYYVEHWSVPFDLWIVFRTVFGGFTGRQAY